MFFKDYQLQVHNLYTIKNREKKQTKSKQSKWKR